MTLIAMTPGVGPVGVSSVISSVCWGTVADAHECWFDFWACGHEGGCLTNSVSVECGTVVSWVVGSEVLASV